MASMTPMMRQYLQLKEKYSDCLLFFRLGDFYEMFLTMQKQHPANLNLHSQDAIAGLKSAHRCAECRTIRLTRT